MLSVLIVDDEKWVRRGIVEKAEWGKLGAFVAAEACNGLEGLEKAREHRPDIVITDMKMPVMDGVEFITQLHAQFPDISVIVISGYSDYEYTRQALLHKAVDYLLKPIEKNELNNVLMKTVSWHISNVKEKQELTALKDGKKGSIEMKAAAKIQLSADLSAKQTVNKVIDFIQNHYDEKITLASISEQYYISETYFCKTFKKVTEKNFVDFLTEIRMQKAKELFENYNMKVYEVASLVGYKDVRHFSKLYRGYFKLLLKQL